MAPPLGELARERLRGRTKLMGAAPHPVLRDIFPKGTAERSEAERVQPAENLCRLFPQRCAFAESGAANAVLLHDPLL